MKQISLDDVRIYLNATKISLAMRSKEELSAVKELASQLGSNFNKGSSITYDMSDLSDFILQFTSQSIENVGWNADDIDGVAWSIANYTDAMTKAGIINDYDSMFTLCFKKYFNIV